MSEERKKALEMLAAGKITREEAEPPLETLEAPAREAQTPFETSGSADAPVQKHLRAVVDGAERDLANIRVPLAFVRTGIKLSTVPPPQATAKMKEKGFDFSALGELEGDELMKALNDLKIDVESSYGDTVRVFCE